MNIEQFQILHQWQQEELKVHLGKLDSAQALFCEVRNKKRYWLGTE